MPSGMAPSGAPTRQIEDEVLRLALKSVDSFIVIAPLAALALLLATPHASIGRRLVIVVWASSFALLSFVLAQKVQQRMAEGPRPEGLLNALTLALCGMASTWSFAPLLLDPGSLQTTYVALFFTVAAIASSKTASNAYSPWFYALLGSIVLPLALGIVLGDVGRLIPASTLIAGVPFVVLLVVGHRSTNRVIYEAVRDRLAQERLSKDLASANARLVHQAEHDGLTGLANRSRFLEELGLAVDEAHRDGAGVAVLYVDVDRFKVINDSLGHAMGDELLQQVARRLKQALRGGDVLGRIGGDEFTVLLPRVRDPAEARAVGERIRGALLRPFPLGGNPVVVTASIGVAHSSSPADTAADLLRHADAALYLAKGDGRNRVVVFDDRLRAELVGRLDREVELRAALDRGEFEAWYQPIVDARTGEILAVEALARWRHPTRGILGPAEFLPVLTDCGLLSELSVHVGARVRAFRQTIEDHVPGSFRAFVNLTENRRPLAAAVDEMVNAVESDETDPRGLGLEITEDTLIGELGPARDAIARARARGMAVVLDDLGTAYASLALVRELPLDGLKIDKSFVGRMLREPADDAVVAAVAALGRRLGVNVTAEGVETAEQLAHLRLLGVNRIQGYYYSPAVPPERLVAWLQTAPPWRQVREHDTTMPFRLTPRVLADS